MAARRPTRHDEVPDADALEQALPATGDELFDDDATGDALPAIDALRADVPEADALEQAIAVAEPDQEWRDTDD